MSTEVPRKQADQTNVCMLTSDFVPSTDKDRTSDVLRRSLDKHHPRSRRHRTVSYRCTVWCRTVPSSYAADYPYSPYARGTGPATSVDIDP